MKGLLGTLELQHQLKAFASGKYTDKEVGGSGINHCQRLTFDLYSYLRAARKLPFT